MEVTFHIDQEDVWTFTRYVYWHEPRLRRQLYLMLILPPLAAFFVGRITHPHLLLNVVTALIIGGLVILLSYWSMRRAVIKAATGQAGVLGEHTLAVGPEGVHERTAVNEGLHRWSGIQAIVEDKKHIYLMLSMNMGHIIPKRAFASEAEAQNFLQASRRYHSAAAS